MAETNGNILFLQMPNKFLLFCVKFLAFFIAAFSLKFSNIVVNACQCVFSYKLFAESAYIKIDSRLFIIQRKQFFQFEVPIAAVDVNNRFCHCIQRIAQKNCRRPAERGEGSGISDYIVPLRFADAMLFFRIV